jgi:phosphoribosylformylglycinamidine synthase
VLALPAVADKTFLITIGDRTVGGLVTRDPMVGPWQVPVADCAVTLAGFDAAHAGEAMAMGERTPLALLDGRGVGAHGGRRGDHQPRRGAIGALGDVKLSANWMAPPATPARTPRCSTRCARSAWSSARRSASPIPVGKDSMSMRTSGATGRRRARDRAGVADRDRVRAVTTSARARSRRAARDGGHGAAAGRPRRRSQPARGLALAQVLRQLGDEPPDVDDPARSRGFFGDPCAARARPAARLSRPLRRRPVRHAWRDGLRRRRAASTSSSPRCSGGALAVLFAEELGAVLQVRRADLEAVRPPRSREGLARPRLAGDRASRPRPAAPRPHRAMAERTLCSTERARCARAGRDDPRMQRLRDDPPAPTRSTRASLRSAAPGLSPISLALRPSVATSPPRSSRAARGRASRSCASRASTARSRWRRPSTAPASTRSTCT